jgi:hypothetical protein
MRAVTLARYLIGDLEAARTIASDPWRAIGVGLLFVTAAMIAREHDGVYLPAEPIHAALPFVGGLGGALASGSLLYAVSRLRGGASPGFGVMVTRWTALFLWTAPLAWLYGIPWERALDEHDAAVLNMMMLGLVATWRVTLSIRAGAMLFGASRTTVALVLLGVAAPLVAFGLLQQMMPLLVTMGGGRLPAGAAVAAGVSSRLLLVAMPAAIVLPILGLLAALDRSQPWSAATLGPPQARTNGPWGIALLALALGAPALALGQREQWHAHEVNVALVREDADAVIDALEDHRPEDFPPHWEPAPRGLFPWRPRARLLLDLLDASDTRPTTPRWARDHWLGALGELGAGYDRDRSVGPRFLARIAASSDADVRAMEAASDGVARELRYWPTADERGQREDEPLLEAARRRLGVELDDRETRF